MIESEIHFLRIAVGAVCIHSVIEELTFSVRGFRSGIDGRALPDVIACSLAVITCIIQYFCYGGCGRGVRDSQLKPIDKFGGSLRALPKGVLITVICKLPAPSLSHHVLTQQALNHNAQAPVVASFSLFFEMITKMFQSIDVGIKQTDTKSTRPVPLPANSLELAGSLLCIGLTLELMHCAQVVHHFISSRSPIGARRPLDSIAGGFANGWVSFRTAELALVPSLMPFLVLHPRITCPIWSVWADSTPIRRVRRAMGRCKVGDRRDRDV